jgi:glyoxylase-like metal-dependent hydrolase (beta-lactamase superfamily II)
MRVIAVHPDALVVTSRMWQANAVLLRGARGEEAAEAMLVDSPYFPDELDALPTLGRETGFEVEALLATHADFDHLLGRLAFPGLALGAGPATVERLQELPVPGRLELGHEELELHPAGGHTADGMAILARHAGVLLSGDYLSNVEIPVISPGGSLEEYRATLTRLAPLVEAAKQVVPGHGSPQDRERALRVLDEDIDYLDALERGEDRPPLPAGRDSPRQRRIHTENLAVCA